MRRLGILPAALCAISLAWAASAAQSMVEEGLADAPALRHAGPELGSADETTTGCPKVCTNNPVRGCAMNKCINKPNRCGCPKPPPPPPPPLPPTKEDADVTAARSASRPAGPPVLRILSNQTCDSKCPQGYKDANHQACCTCVALSDGNREAGNPGDPNSACTSCKDGHFIAPFKLTAGGKPIGYCMDPYYKHVDNKVELYRATSWSKCELSECHDADTGDNIDIWKTKHTVCARVCTFGGINTVVKNLKKKDGTLTEFRWKNPPPEKAWWKDKSCPKCTFHKVVACKERDSYNRTECDDCNKKSAKADCMKDHNEPCIKEDCVAHKTGKCVGVQACQDDYNTPIEISDAEKAECDEVDATDVCGTMAKYQ